MTAPIPASSASSLPPATAMPLGRRRALYAGVAAAAAVGGAGLAWWRLQPQAVQAGAEQALWTQAFDTPEGARLAMAEFVGKPLLLNFWATWCPPCVEELPLLNQFYREHAAKSWQVVGLAIDQPSAVRKFLQKTPLAFPVVMGGLDGTEISRSMGNLGGSLPFTVVVDARGQVVHRKMGALHSDELQTLAKAYSV